MNKFSFGLIIFERTFIFNCPTLVSNHCSRSQDCTLGNLNLKIPHLFISIHPEKISYQSWLLMASPYPGVSTTVRRSFTPRSSISTVDASIWTVRSIFSVGRNKMQELITIWEDKVSPRWSTFNTKCFKTRIITGVFYLLLQGWLSRGKGQWGTSCWSGWIFQVQIHLLTTEGRMNQSSCGQQQYETQSE